MTISQQSKKSLQILIDYIKNCIHKPSSFSLHQCYSVNGTLQPLKYKIKVHNDECTCYTEANDDDLIKISANEERVITRFLYKHRKLT